MTRFRRFQRKWNYLFVTDLILACCFSKVRDDLIDACLKNSTMMYLNNCEVFKKKLEMMEDENVKNASLVLF